MFDNRREIMQDVFLTYLPAQRFKTSRMTVQLIAPLQRETAAANALLPAVLRRGTVRCPDMESPTARSCWSLCRRCLASCCWTL